MVEAPRVSAVAPPRPAARPPVFALTEQGETSAREATETLTTAAVWARAAEPPAAAVPADRPPSSELTPRSEPMLLSAEPMPPVVEVLVPGDGVPEPDGVTDGELLGEGELVDGDGEGDDELVDGAGDGGVTGGGTAAPEWPLAGPG